jgi:hypothetical protein
VKAVLGSLSEKDKAPQKQEVYTVALESIREMIREGEALLANSPAQTLELRKKRHDDPRRTLHDIVLSQAEAREREEANKEMMELKELELVVKENIELVNLVAQAEQQVLHKRLEICFLRCAEEGGPQQQSAGRGDILTISHEDRQLNIPMESYHWNYIRLGIGTCPRHHRSSLATIQSSNPSHQPKRIQVDCNLVAAAMREWSRHEPHTVSELVDGQWIFHSSATLWWNWPSVPTVVESIPALSLFDAEVHRSAASAFGGTEQSLRDAVLLQSSGLDGGTTVGLTDETLRLFGGRAYDFVRVGSSGKDHPQDGADALERLAQTTNADGFWSHFLDHWDALAKDLQKPGP